MNFDVFNAFDAFDEADRKKLKNRRISNEKKEEERTT